MPLPQGLARCAQSRVPLSQTKCKHKWAAEGAVSPGGHGTDINRYIRVRKSLDGLLKRNRNIPLTAGVGGHLNYVSIGGRGSFVRSLMADSRSN